MLLGVIISAIIAYIKLDLSYRNKLALLSPWLADADMGF